MSKLTAYEVLEGIEREIKASHPYRPLVYICSPYRGATNAEIDVNIDNAQRYCSFAVKHGAIPFAPHLFYPSFMDDGDETQRKLGLFFGLVWLGKCQEVWVFGGRISEGMALEIAKAEQRKRIIIRYFNEDCEEVTHDTESRTLRPNPA